MSTPIVNTPMVMKIIYGLLIAFGIAVIALACRSCIPETTSFDTVHTVPESNIVPQIAAYTMHSNDPNTDLYKSPREYKVEKGYSATSVVLTCDETRDRGVRMDLWNNFKGHLQFNPVTGQGMWEGQEDEVYQKALVKLTPNGFGGFYVEFTYPNTGNVRMAELAPVR